jgi:hypothetical protein
MEIEMQYANNYGYSDVNPYEVVRVVSDKTIEIRRMDAVRANPENSLGFAPGGFFGHCSRQDEQKWIITPSDTAAVFRIRLGKRGWKDRYGNRYNLSDKPVKFHDFNF